MSRHSRKGVTVPAEGSSGRSGRPRISLLQVPRNLADEHYQEAASRMSDRVVVCRVKTRAGDDEVLVQTAQSPEAGETHPKALAEAETLLKLRSSSGRSS
jgi:hypothetical protein